jgi:hypothetical protein
VSSADNPQTNNQFTTWKNNGIHTAVVQYQDNFDTTNKASSTSYTSTLAVTDAQNNSVIVDCTPPAPTGSGTLTYDAMTSSLKFTPDATLGAKPNYMITVYRADTNAVVAVGSPMGVGTTPIALSTNCQMPCMGPPTLPGGVAMYAKLQSSVNVGSNTFNSAQTAAIQCSTNPCVPVPQLTFTTDATGNTAEGSTVRLADEMDWTNANSTLGYLYNPGGATSRYPVSDSKGGFWAWKDTVGGIDFMHPDPNAVPTFSLKLFHYTQTGADSVFGVNGTEISTKSGGGYQMGWYGDRTKWVGALTTFDQANNTSDYAHSNTGLDVITGTTSSSAVTTKSYTTAQMASYCDAAWTGSKFTSLNVTVVNTSAANPWLLIACSTLDNATQTPVFRGTVAESTANGLRLLTRINDETTSVDNAYSVFSTTAYPNASTAGDTAAALVVATGTASASNTQGYFNQLFGAPMLSTSILIAVPIAHRKLIRLTKAGTPSVLLDDSAWAQSTPAPANFSALFNSPSIPRLPNLSANGALMALTKNSTGTYYVTNAGTSGGVALGSADNDVTFNEQAVPTGLTAGPATYLAWPTGAQVVGATGNPTIARYSRGMSMTPAYNLTAGKLDLSTLSVTSGEVLRTSVPSGLTQGWFADNAGRLVSYYSSDATKFKFIRWVGSASLPEGVTVDSTLQSTNYVINAGGDVVLTGTGLGASSGATQVTSAKVNGVAATIKSRTATTLTITAPANNTATAQAPVTGNIELFFPNDQSGVVGTLTYVGASKLTPVITQTVSGANTAYFGDADRDLSVSVAMTPGQALTATTTSNAAVCTIVGTKVHFVAAGTCTVTSTVAAGGYFNAATPAVNTITVSKPTPTITLNVGALTAFASDADRTISASATLDTNGTAPAPVVTATPASVCTIVAGKVHFVTSGNCVVKAEIAASAAINGDIETATIVVSKTTPTVSVSVAGATSGLVGDDDRAITVTASAGTATVTSNSPLVCSIVPAVDQTPIKVHFIGAGNCVVKAQVASSATINASNVALSTGIAVLLADTITYGFADGDAPNKSATVDGAVMPVVTAASGRDVTLTGPQDTTKCEVTADGLIWFKSANDNCVITISTGADTAVYAGKTVTWTIVMLPAIGADANSALQVPNNGVVTKLATTALTWTQSTNSVKMNVYTKYVGLFKARMTFTDRDGNVQNCDVSFGSAAKVTGAQIKAVKTFTSPAFCANNAAVYTKFKNLVTYNTGQSEGTSVQVSYVFEKHFANTGALYTNETLLATKSLPSTVSFANLYFLAFDKITAALPASTVASVSSDASGAVIPVVTLDSKRTDWTMTSADNTKCEVTSDRRVWSKAAGQDCVLTIATLSQTGAAAKWKAKSTTLTFRMGAAVGADLASAPLASSNGTAVNVGPLNVVWTQASSSVVLKVNSRNVGLASAKMTFTPLTGPDVTCTIASFGSALKNTAVSADAVKTQTSAKFCTGADLAKFTALVTARKTGAGQGVIPVTIAYKFEQHDPTTGAIIGSPLASLSWSHDLTVKLNWRINN